MLIATSIHSKFKLGVIHKINGQLQPEVKNQLLDEVAKFTSDEFVVEEVEEQDNDDDFFKVTIFANELTGLHRYRALHSNFNKNYCTCILGFANQSTDCFCPNSHFSPQDSC